MIYCNTRNLLSGHAGVQRYTNEILKHFPQPIQCIQPKRALRGLQGHAWEQLVLPYMSRHGVLWSPSNSGPMFYRRQVVSVLDMATLDCPHFTTASFARLYKTLYPLALRSASHILTISEFSKSRIIHHYPFTRNKITVTYLGSSEVFMQRSINEAAPVLRRYGVKPRKYFVSVGSLEPRKNLTTVLRAWKEFQGSDIANDKQLLIIGTPVDGGIFQDVDLSDLPANVRRLGYVNDYDLSCLYSNALASLYLSLYEGFGLPVLESMKSGCPVICSNTTSLPEVVGDSGISTNPLCPLKVADQLANVANSESLHQKLTAMGLKRSRIFSWEESAKKTYEILHQFDTSF